MNKLFEHVNGNNFVLNKNIQSENFNDVKTKVSTFVQNLLKKGGYSSYGFAGFTYENGKLTISYGGNMGASIQRDVDPILFKMNLPSVEEIKAAYPSHKEEGTPDYDWYITFKAN